MVRRPVAWSLHARDPSFHGRRCDVVTDCTGLVALAAALAIDAIINLWRALRNRRGSAA